MRRIVVGTAGHIDHGKTSLVRALTGVDCDRWIEEKERGITIDIGFAHLREEDVQIGFVDVPGHERFVHNALAGLGGIDTMILVVAADEGVKPQTLEHLAICSLLEIPAGLAVLTKADLVAEDLLDIAQLELEDALIGTPFEGAPILAVSSQTGVGLEELKARLFEIAGQAEPPKAQLTGPARLPVDRVFHLKGLGTLATGTLCSGEVQTGATLEALPGGQRARVRSIQVHGEERESALAGERTSIQLGGVDLEQLERGCQLVSPGAYGVSRRLLTNFTLLKNAPKKLSGFVPIRFHLYSAERIGKARPLDQHTLEPGDTGLVEIRLDAPVVVARGDRFVVRRPSPQTTIGGGEVLDPEWHRPRGRRLAGALDQLKQSSEEALLYWADRAGEGGIELQPLASRLGRPAEEVSQQLAGAVDQQRLLAIPQGRGHGRRWIVPDAYRRIVARTRQGLEEYFRRNRLAVGMPKAEALASFLPGRASQVGDVYLDWLAKQKILVLAGENVDLPGRGSGLSTGESELALRIVAAFERQGLTPGSPPEICRSLGAKPQVFEGLLRHLTSSGKLVRLPSGLFLSGAALEGMRHEIAKSDWGRFGVGRFKEHFGLTRKWAIPLLEYLDQQRITRRVGNERELVSRTPA